MSNSIEERVRKIFAENLEVDPAKLTLEARLVDDIGADSLDVTEAVLSIEDEFKVTIDDRQTDMTKIKTFGDVVNLVTSLVNAGEQQHAGHPGYPRGSSQVHASS